MFNGMMDPELMRIAQEQMSRMSPADMARIQQQMMSNPELLKMATESMQNFRPEDMRQAAERMKHIKPEEMDEISEKIANASPEELASARAQMDAQVSYAISAAERLKKQGNEFHNKGQYKNALQKYMQAKKSIGEVPTSKSRNIVLACCLNLMSCYLKTSQYDECIAEGTEALGYDEKNVKALYRRGKAYKELGRLEDAVSDLSKALEVSPGDDTIADVLRDAEEKLIEGGGNRRSRGIVIEEITEEEEETVMSYNQKNSKAADSASRPKETNQCSTRPTERPKNAEYLEALRDNPETIRSFQEFVSRTDPETLSALSGGNMKDLPPNLVKNVSNMIGKMSPEELKRMSELAASTDLQGQPPFSSSSSSFSPGSVPSNLSPEMIKTATDMMGKMSPEDLQKMFEMSSSMRGNGPVPPNMSPDMIKMATEMMGNMPSEELQKMFEMASSMKGQETAPSTTSSNSSGSRIREIPAPRDLPINSIDVSETSSVQSLNSRSTTSNSLNSTGDLQEQMRNQMKDPAMRQMLSSMMKTLSPEMMSNMSEQFGVKLSPEDAQRAQQTMSSLSPESLDSMLKWADRIQCGVEGARKTKNWLLGRQGLILAILMLLLAFVLQWFGVLGR